MTRCIYISLYPVQDRTTVASNMLGNLYISFLQKYFGKDEVKVLSVNNDCYMTGFESLKMKIQSLRNGNLMGLTKAIEKMILLTISDECAEYVFLSTSNIGCIAPKIKKISPSCKIGVIFHNIEYQYFMEYVHSVGKRKLYLAWIAKYNEKKLIGCSDYNILLNTRDVNLLKSIYGCRKNLICIPMSMIDAFNAEMKNKKESDGILILFVGSNFFPNYQGIKWFIKNVLSYIDAKLMIVGNGMELHKEEFEVNRKVMVYGCVEDISEFYNVADLVVEPIFAGGGMKTKTAEALMFGKCIFGTKEAFEGYDLEYGTYAELCNTAEEYINLFRVWKEKNKFNNFSQEARDVFVNKYSYEASYEKFCRMMRD